MLPLPLVLLPLVLVVFLRLRRRLLPVMLLVEYYENAFEEKVNPSFFQNNAF